MEISPYQNGIHSLAEGLRNLSSFFEEQDPFKMKEVVIKIHHGLETLMKNVLFQTNPMFLLDKETTIKKAIEYYQGYLNQKNHFIFEEAKTITPTEAASRLRELHICKSMSDQEFTQFTNSFKELNTLRNQIQHFAIKADSDTIIRILGNLIPRSLVLLRSCYSFNGVIAGTLTHKLLTHAPSIIPQLTLSRSIEDELNTHYPGATNLISSIEAKYDTLLNNAIKKLKKKCFNDINQSISITDHGKVGSPPYMPRISLRGWMNDDFAPNTNRTGGVQLDWDGPFTATYSATLNIEQPKIKPRSKLDTHTTSELSVKFEAIISVLNMGAFFKIPTTEEDISFIKQAEIKIQMLLLCEVEGRFDEQHFDTYKTRDLSGEINTTISAAIFGDKKDEPSIFGQQSISLTTKNTSLNLSAFVERGKILDGNRLLRISFEDTAPLKFN